MPRRVTRVSRGVDPYILLMGCRPWSAADEHARKRKCPVCHGATGRDEKRLVLCAKCSSASPLMARLIVVREVGRAESDRRQQAAESERAARERLKRRFPVVLDEKTRRLIWNGYRGILGRELETVTNLAAVGRAWLREIGQEPTWVDEPAAELVTA